MAIVYDPLHEVFEYHIPGLEAALRSVGIPIDGCAADGRIDFRQEATVEQRTLAAEILATHDYEASVRAEVQEKADAALDALCSARFAKLQRRAALMRAGVTGARITDVDAEVAALDGEIKEKING